MSLSLLLALSLIGCSAPAEENNGENNTNNATDAGGGGGADAGADAGGGEDAGDDAGGGEVSPDVTIPEGCNPIAFEHDCLFPYPSDVFLTDDAETPSGKRVAITGAAQPTDAQGAPFDFTLYHSADGFSFNQPIMVRFPGGVDTDGVVFHTDDPAGSTVATSQTILLDTATGELVPHWAEVDLNTEVPGEQTFIIRPYVVLSEQTRYVVALQGLSDAGGATIAAPNGFAQIRDGSVRNHPVLSPLAARYDADVFPALEAAGLTRADLQLAWDFTTGSYEHVTRDMFAMRQATIDALSATPPAVTVTKTEVDPRDQIALRIEGTITVPLFLESTELSARLNRDADGDVAQNGTAEVPFLLQVGKGAEPTEAGFTPRRIIQYGHGFFGLREEINYSAMRTFSNDEGYVMASVDWWGMSDPDQLEVVGKLSTDMSASFVFVDRIHQAMINQLALTYALETTIAELTEVEYFGERVYDPEDIYYYGISQGHILGGAFIALSPQIERAAFSVGGGNFSLMMSRASNFRPFLDVILAVTGSRVTVQKVVTLCQHSFDRVSPIVYGRYIQEAPLPGNPAKKILMQAGIGDLQVNNLATDLHARSIGVPSLQPNARDPFGLDPVSSPTSGSALVYLDFNLDEVPGLFNRTPPEGAENEVHEGVRRTQATEDQLDAFFQPDGEIVNFCDGACDPE
jgi:hypothetical protein